MPDIMVWPGIILVIALVSGLKSKMASISARLSYINYHHFRRKGQKSTILMSSIVGFLGRHMADIVCGWKVH